METKKCFLNCIIIFICTIPICQIFGQDVSHSFQEFTIKNEEDIEKAIRFQLIQKNYENVLKIIDEHLVLTDNKDPSHLFADSKLKAYCLVMLNKYDEAEEYLSEVCQKFPDITGLNIYKAYIECANDNYGKATLSLTKEIENCLLPSTENQEEKYKISFWAYNMRACVYACRGFKEKAQNDLYALEKLLQQHPDCPKPYYAIALYVVPVYLNDATNTIKFTRMKDIPILSPPKRIIDSEKISLNAPRIVWTTTDDFNGELQKAVEKLKKDMELYQNQTKIEVMPNNTIKPGIFYKSPIMKNTNENLPDISSLNNKLKK
jgi:tetratricopeptide (TPR) repeat protein